MLPWGKRNIDIQEQKLNAKSKDLSSLEQRLKKQDSDLSAREQACSELQQKLDALKQDLNAREQALREREHALDERESVLEVAAKDFAKKEVALDRSQARLNKQLSDFSSWVDTQKQAFAVRDASYLAIINDLFMHYTVNIDAAWSDGFLGCEKLPSHLFQGNFTSSLYEDNEDNGLEPEIGYCVPHSSEELLSSEEIPSDTAATSTEGDSTLGEDVKSIPESSISSVKTVRKTSQRSGISKVGGGTITSLGLQVVLGFRTLEQDVKNTVEDVNSTAEDVDTLCQAASDSEEIEPGSSEDSRSNSEGNLEDKEEDLLSSEPLLFGY